ncbi:AAA family ATPase, partial [Streptomyces gamaensis]
MRTVERDEARTLLRELLASAAGGSGRAVLVLGAPGAGRTTLFRDVRAAAAEAGATVLATAGARAERGLPLGLVGRLFAGTGGPAGPFGAPLPADAGESGFVAGEPGRDGTRPPAAAHSVHRHVHELAARAPVLLLVDDVQDSDPASLECLLHVVRRLAGERVLVVLGGSGGEPAVTSSLTAEFLRTPGCELVRLTPLDVPAVAALLAPRLGRAQAHAAAPAWQRLTGGSPLLLHALIKDTDALPSPTSEAPGTRQAQAHTATPARQQPTGGNPSLLHALDEGTDTALSPPPPAPA